MASHGATLSFASRHLEGRNAPAVTSPGCQADSVKTWGVIGALGVLGLACSGLPRASVPSSGAGEADSAWKPYASESGAYTATYPEPPIIERSEVETRLGAVILNTERFDDTATGVSYSVSYFDLPGQVTVSRPQLIEIARRNFSAEASAVHSEGPIVISGYDGHQMEIELDAETARAVRVVAAGKRMFYVVAEGAREGVLQDGARRFLPSFAVRTAWAPHPAETFRVEVPLLASHRSAWRRVAGMPTEYDLFDLDRGHDAPLAFFVGRTPVPQEMTASTSPAVLLRLAESSLSEDAEIVQRSDLRAGPWVARHYVMRLPEQGSGELRIIAADGEIYQLGIITPDGAGVPAETARFFASFATLDANPLSEDLTTASTLSWLGDTAVGTPWASAVAASWAPFGLETARSAAPRFESSAGLFALESAAFAAPGVR